MTDESVESNVPALYDEAGTKTRMEFVTGEEFVFSPGSLIGSWFHRLENDVMVWQGVVLAEIATGTFLTHIDKLAPGAENVQRIVTLEQLTNDDDGYDWRFYDSEDEARSAYALWLAAERQRA
jgi:hypothetical protein